MHVLGREETGILGKTDAQFQRIALGQEKIVENIVSYACVGCITLTSIEGVLDINELGRLLRLGPLNSCLNDAETLRHVNNNCCLQVHESDGFKNVRKNGKAQTKVNEPLFIRWFHLPDRRADGVVRININIDRDGERAKWNLTRESRIGIVQSDREWKNLCNVKCLVVKGIGATSVHNSHFDHFRCHIVLARRQYQWQVGVDREHKFNSRIGAVGIHRDNVDKYRIPHGFRHDGASFHVNRHFGRV